MNPLLWLAAICVFALVPIVLFAEGIIAWIAVGILLSPIPVALVAYIYLLINDRDRLHTEKHQMDLKRFSLMGDDVSGRPRLTEVELTSNPAGKTINDE